MLLLLVLLLSLHLLLRRRLLLVLLFLLSLLPRTLKEVQDVALEQGGGGEGNMAEKVYLDLLVAGCKDFIKNKNKEKYGY